MKERERKRSNRKKEREKRNLTLFLCSWFAANNDDRASRLNRWQPITFLQDRTFILFLSHFLLLPKREGERDGERMGKRKEFFPRAVHYIWCSPSSFSFFLHPLSQLLTFFFLFYSWFSFSPFPSFTLSSFLSFSLSLFLWRREFILSECTLYGNDWTDGRIPFVPTLTISLASTHFFFPSSLKRIRDREDWNMKEERKRREKKRRCIKGGKICKWMQNTKGARNQ